jgi:hypothetical protein
VNPALLIFNWLSTVGELASEAQPAVNNTVAKVQIRIICLFLDGEIETNTKLAF